MGAACGFDTAPASSKTCLPPELCVARRNLHTGRTHTNTMLSLLVVATAAAVGAASAAWSARIFSSGATMCLKIASTNCALAAATRCAASYR